MLKHLIYNIPRGYKVGYGALFTKIFQECGVDMCDEPIILPRDENLFGKHSLVLFKFQLVEGKLVEGGVSDAVDSDVEVVEKRKEEGEKKEVEEGVGDSKADKKKGAFERQERAKKRAHTPVSKPERPVKRRLVRKKKEEPPLEKKKETSSSREGTEGDAAKEPPTDKSSGSDERIEKLFTLVMAKLLDIQTAQQHNEDEISQLKEGQKCLETKLDECTSKIDLLESKLSSLQQILLDKMDSLVVEEVPVEDESAPPIVPSVTPSP